MPGPDPITSADRTERAANRRSGDRPPIYLVRVARRLAVTLGATAVAWAGLWVLDGLIRGPRGWSEPWAPLLTASLIGLSVLGYIGWPSRWNIPAHMQLAFGVTAYFIPTVLGDSFDAASPSVLAFYAAVVIVGFFASVIGASFGAELRIPHRADIAAQVQRVPTSRISRRVLVVTLVAATALAACFLVMGFVPAFVTSDPLNAKFFRGAYAERYAPVAVYYRAAVSALVVLMPAVTLYAVWRRKWYWVPALATSVFLLVCTLQRGNAIAGAILFAGVAIARLRHRAWSYGFFAVLVLVYGFGSASYVLLRALGIGEFAASGVDTTNIAAVVAAGAPDVTDHLSFVSAWLNHPEYTFGRTFVGGLLPFHFEWNPAVWTLMIQQPGADLSTIASGGLRLPAPVWGFVSFGWAGVVGVSAVSGFLIAFVSAAVRGVVRMTDREYAVLAVVLYSALVDVVGQFYILSYTSVFELLLLGAVLFLPRWIPRMRKAGRSRPVAGDVPASVPTPDDRTSVPIPTGSATDLSKEPR